MRWVWFKQRLQVIIRSPLRTPEKNGLKFSNVCCPILWTSSKSKAVAFMFGFCTILRSAPTALGIILLKCGLDMESSMITFISIPRLRCPSSTFFIIGGNVSVWKMLPKMQLHLKNRKLNPFSRFVLTASCTAAVKVSFGKVFQSLTAFPISGLTEAIWMLDHHQHTLASHDSLWWPDSVIWNEQISG